jgi:chitinase
MGQNTYRLFSQMVSTPGNRKQFIDSAIAYAQQYGFNGIDIDWEYPGDLKRGGTEGDFDNFLLFLQELYAACKAVNLTATYASAAMVPGGVPQSYRDNPATYYQWLAKCSQHVDWLNVMCYDYHGAFDVPKLTGVNAPLNQDAQTIENYLTNGVSSQKIVMGMPLYGRSFGGVAGMTDQVNGPGLPFTTAGAPGPSTGEAGLLAYFEIADMVALHQLTFATDVPTKTAYGFNLNTQEWVSFDTPDTIALKAQLILSYQLRGGMFWAIDEDEYWWDRYPNIQSAYHILQPKEDHANTRDDLRKKY